MTLVVVGDVNAQRRKPTSPRHSPAGPAVKIIFGRGARPPDGGKRDLGAAGGQTQRERAHRSGQRTALQRSRQLALRIGTAILGSGFTGRLMGTVRDKEGLTYNIGAGMGMTASSMALGISASFAPALLAKEWIRLGASRQWWKERRHRAGIGGAQAGHGRRLSGRPVDHRGPRGHHLTDVQRGYDVNRVAEYPKAVKALTREQVNGAIKKHLNPNVMVLVEAGSVAPAAQAFPK